MNCLTVIHKKRTYSIYPCNIIYCKSNPTNLLIKVAIFVNSASKHLNNPKLCGTLSIVNSVCKTLNRYQYLHECSHCIYFSNTSRLMFFLGFPSALLSGVFPFLALLSPPFSLWLKTRKSWVWKYGGLSPSFHVQHTNEIIFFKTKSTLFLNNGLFWSLHWAVFPKPLFYTEFTKSYHVERGLNSATTFPI